MNKGAVLVDVYYIPAKRAKKYISEREQCAEMVIQIMKEFCLQYLDNGLNLRMVKQ